MRRIPAWLETVREFFWVAALALIGIYLFFLILGAYSAGSVLPLSIVIGALIVLWALHAWIGHRRQNDADPRLRHARERRGF